MKIQCDVYEKEEAFVFCSADICQERHAYVYCREDRAIFCTECDLTIHGGNENSKKHNRFLLTGVKIGASSSEEGSFGCNRNMASDKSSVSRGYISEYFIETIPDYCMEDLFDVSFAP